MRDTLAAHDPFTEWISGPLAFGDSVGVDYLTFLAGGGAHPKGFLPIIGPRSFKLQSVSTLGLPILQPLVGLEADPTTPQYIQGFHIIRQTGEVTGLMAKWGILG